MYLVSDWYMCRAEKCITTPPPPKPELQMIVSCHVGAGNQTHSILCKSSKGFQPLSQLSIPTFKRKILGHFILFP